MGGGSSGGGLRSYSVLYRRGRKVTNRARVLVRRYVRKGSCRGKGGAVR